MTSHYDAADAKTKAKVQAEWSAMLDSVSDSDSSDSDAEGKAAARCMSEDRACSVRHGHHTIYQYKDFLSQNPGAFKAFLDAIGEQNKLSYETHHPGCTCWYHEKRAVEKKKEADEALRNQMDYFLLQHKKKQLSEKDIEKLLGWTNYWAFVAFRAEQRNNAK